jgi:hypothetical protein
MTKKEIIKRINKWVFSSCPTEEKEPFFWRWSKRGTAELADYIYELLEEERQDRKERLKRIC